VKLDADTTAIVLDSTADLADAPERFGHWRVVPLYVRFGDESFRDHVDLAPDEFYRRLREADELPTTSQPTPADFAAVYEELAGYERVYSLHIAGTLSGTAESARLAAAETGGRVRVIDTMSASAGIAMLALAIQRRLERGTTDDEIDALAERHRGESELVFTLETLEYLRRGGRIGKAGAAAGQLLNIKPILTITDGEVMPLKRVRGNAKAFAEFVRLFTGGTCDTPDLRVGVAHADAPDKAESLAAMVQRERPAATIEVVTQLGPVLATHAGPGCVGFFWFEDAS
jgi:DegV family protein with EDD domain